jgi:hypothetical protein
MTVSTRLPFGAFAAVAALALLASGCASAPVPPEGMKTGQFVRFACDGAAFQARASDDGRTVRVRTLHGSAELDKKQEGVFEGDGFRLATTGAERISLTHNGKVQGKNCKPA